MSCRQLSYCIEQLHVVDRSEHCLRPIGGPLAARCSVALCSAARCSVYTVQSKRYNQRQMRH